MQREVVTTSDIASVFAAITDHANMPQWSPQVHSAELQTEGPLKVGSVVRQRRQMGAQIRDADLTVTEYDPPHQFKLAASAMGVAMTTTFQLRAENGGTHITFTHEIRGYWIMRPLVSRIGAALERKEGDILERLKRWVEDGEPSRPNP